MPVTMYQQYDLCDDHRGAGGAWEVRAVSWWRRFLKRICGKFFEDGGEEHYAPLLGEGPIE